MAVRFQESIEQEKSYSAVFDVFTSLGYKSAIEGNTFAEIVEAISKRSKFANKDEFQILVNAVKSNPDLGNCVIMGQSWLNPKYDSGTAACVFQDPAGNVYVSFAGTQDGEWPDNGTGMFSVSTTQQERAAAYFDDMAETYGWTPNDNIIVTGHSKGGNKAQYITLMSGHADLIDRCYSMDGQGFSPEAIAFFKEKYGKEQYEEILQKMYSICGNNDFVNEFGITIIPQDHRQYIKKPVEGMDMVGFHEIKNFFLKDGEFTGTVNEPTERGDMSYLAEDLSRMVMSLPIEERQAVAMTVMQLCELLIGDEHVIGLDGTVLTPDQLKLFMNKDMAKIIYALLASETGRKILLEQGAAFIQDLFRENPGQAIALLYGIAIAVPSLICIVYNIAPYVSLLLTGIERLKRLGADFQDAAGFFAQAAERIGELCLRIDDWAHGRGIGADDSRLRFDEGTAIGAQEELAGLSAELRDVAQRVRSIKNQIDFGLLTRYAFSIRLAGCAREIDRNAAAAAQMAKALEDGRDVYLRNEERISEKYVR